MTRSRKIGLKSEFHPPDLERRVIHPSRKVADLLVNFENSFDAMVGSIGES